MGLHGLMHYFLVRSRDHSHTAGELKHDLRFPNNFRSIVIDLNAAVHILTVIILTCVVVQRNSVTKKVSFMHY